MCSRGRLRFESGDGQTPFMLRNAISLSDCMLPIMIWYRVAPGLGPKAPNKSRFLEHVWKFEYLIVWTFTAVYWFLRTKQNVFQIAYPCLQREGRERGINTESLHIFVAKCGCQQLKTFPEYNWMQIIGYRPLIKIRKSERCYLCMQIATANLRRTKQQRTLCAVNLCPGMMHFTM